MKTTAHAALALALLIVVSSAEAYGIVWLITTLKP